MIGNVHPSTSEFNDRPQRCKGGRPTVDIQYKLRPHVIVGFALAGLVRATPRVGEIGRLPI